MRFGGWARVRGRKRGRARQLKKSMVRPRCMILDEKRCAERAGKLRGYGDDMETDR